MSLRGHGESWNPGFWRMTWLTGLVQLAQDVRCVWEEVVRREDGRLPVLAGHSSGGGLAQYVLGEGLIQAEALVLCAAVPGFGAMMRPFVSFPRILDNIAGVGKRGTYICIIAGDEDKLVGVQIPEMLANMFRDTVKVLTRTKNVDIAEDAVQDKKMETTEKGCSDSVYGVQLLVFEDAPHHLQNDVHQNEAATRLLAFVDALG
ncbi:MAG: hypothetical protein Q9178_007256 [Gyalolechia marmorata]